MFNSLINFGEKKEKNKNKNTKRCYVKLRSFTAHSREITCPKVYFVSFFSNIYGLVWFTSFLIVTEWAFTYKAQQLSKEHKKYFHRLEGISRGHHEAELHSSLMPNLAKSWSWLRRQHQPDVALSTRFCQKAYRWSQVYFL